MLRKIITAVAFAGALAVGLGVANAAPAQAAAPKMRAPMAASQATVTAWIDGDTVVTNQGKVRLIGMDTPEMKDKCSKAQKAKEEAESLAPAGSTVTLVSPSSVDNKDRYGRLLRYVDTPSTDVGYSLLLDDLAEPRYDSEDGYDRHPREADYRATDGDPSRWPFCVVFLPLGEDRDKAFDNLSGTDDDHHLVTRAVKDAKREIELGAAKRHAAQQHALEILVPERSERALKEGEAEEARIAKRDAETAKRYEKSRRETEKMLREEHAKGNNGGGGGGGGGYDYPGGGNPNYCPPGGC